jgi:hypothetical protein
MMHLSGQVHSFGLDGKRPRTFVTVVLTFREIRKSFQVDLYDALTGDGEQRPEVDAQAKALKKAIQAGTFTPCPLSAGVRPRHLRAARFDDLPGGARRFSLELEAGDHLPLTDGHQRLCACERILEEGDESVLDLAFPVTILLDGDTKLDFLNLQKGRSIDTTHLMSLQLEVGEVAPKDAKFLRTARDVARRLNKMDASPFQKFVRFDSARSTCPIPLKSLCAKGAGDLATSLVGLARVGLTCGDTPATPDWLAGMVCEAVRGLRKYAPEAAGVRRVLSPPPDGNRGSYGMVICLGTLLAYRVLSEGRDHATEDDLEKLAAAARSVDAPINKHFSSARKRLLAGELAKEFFADDACEKHAGVPTRLVAALAPSALGLPPVPKEPRARRKTQSPPRPQALPRPQAQRSVGQPYAAQPGGRSRQPACFEADTPACSPSQLPGADGLAVPEAVRPRHSVAGPKVATRDVVQLEGPPEVLVVPSSPEPSAEGGACNGAQAGASSPAPGPSFSGPGAERGQDLERPDDTPAPERAA